MTGRQIILITFTLIGVLGTRSCETTAAPWPRHVIDNTSRGADGVRLADFDGDGRMDIVTGWEEGGVVRLYLQPKVDGIRDPWPRVTVGRVGNVEDAVPVDLDGDGALDVVSSCEGRTRTIYVHWAPKDKSRLLDESAWKTEPLPQSAGKQMWMFALPLQVDGRRGVDLVVGSKGNGGGLGCFYSPERPRELAAWEFRLAHEMGWMMSLQAQDINGDGAPDVLLSNRHPPRRGIFWLENPDAKSADEGKPNDLSRWTLREIGATDVEVMFLARGNLTGEGHADVLAAAKGRGLQLLTAPRDPAADPWKQQEIPLPDGVGTGKGAAIGDLDLDGTPDIVFTCENANGEKSGVRWLSRESPSAAWTDHEISGPEGVKYDRIELIDLDGDGDLDVLTCEERTNLGVIWYENPAREHPKSSPRN